MGSLWKVGKERAGSILFHSTTLLPCIRTRGSGGHRSKGGGKT